MQNIKHCITLCCQQVVLAKEHSTGKEYASKSYHMIILWCTIFFFVVTENINMFKYIYTVKILEKRHIMKENKAQYVKRERDVMSHLDHPFFVKLYFTFQDEEKLCILHSHMLMPAGWPKAKIIPAYLI